jgi:hypothetical protein
MNSGLKNATDKYFKIFAPRPLCAFALNSYSRKKLSRNSCRFAPSELMARHWGAVQHLRT